MDFTRKVTMTASAVCERFSFHLVTSAGSLKKPGGTASFFLATLVNSSAVKCQIPVGSGILTVDVSLNQQDVSGTGINFTYTRIYHPNYLLSILSSTIKFFFISNRSRK